MNTVAMICECTLQAMLQSLAAGAACACMLVVMLAFFPKLGEQGKYLLCNIAQLGIAAAFLQPFLNILLNSRPADAVKVSSISMAREGINQSPVVAMPVDSTVPSFAERIPEYLGAHSQLISQLYLFGLALFLLRLVAGYYVTLNLRREGRSEPDAMWNEQLRQASEKLGIQRPVRLALSSLVESPCIIGWTKAMILIPVSLASRLSPEQAEAVLLHELAHYRQLHAYINLAAQVAISLLFFNPFAWFIHVRAARHREYASDALAIRHSMQISLAESLLIIAAHRQSSNPLTLGILSRKKQLSHRIQNLLQMQAKTANSRPIAITLCIAAAIACCSYNQLRAVPVNVTKTDTLEVIGRSMQSAGNTNFIIVMALRDSLIRYKNPFELTYREGNFYLNDKLLPEPIQSRYVSLFKDIPNNRQISMWRTESDGVEMKDVLDPKSSFRTYIAVSNTAALPVSTPQISPTPPMVRPGSINSSERLVRSLIADRIIDTLQPVFLAYENSALFVNGRRLKSRMESKYKEFLKQQLDFEAGLSGDNSMQIYPEGVLAPSSTSGNSKMQFPRHPGHKPYAMQISDERVDDRMPSIRLLKQEIVADELADSAFTIHVLYNNKGIFVNSVKLEEEMHQKYARLLTDELKFSTPKQRRDVVDITF